MITVGRRLIQPRVAGTLFGPFASKRLPRLIKAEESPKPDEPKEQPAQESPTPSQEPPPAPPPPAQDIREEPPVTSPSELENTESEEIVPQSHVEPQEEYPMLLTTPDEVEHLLYVDGNGRVIRVENDTIPVEIAQHRMDYIEEESAIDEDDYYEDQNRTEVEPEPPDALKFTGKMDRELLKSIKENPFDDAPRLIFADWIEEKGGQNNADYAELIRLQIHLEQAHPDSLDPNSLGYEKEEIVKQHRRVKELIHTHREEWTWPWLDPYTEFSFDRGMLTLRTDGESFNRITRGVAPERALQLVETVVLWDSSNSATDMLIVGGDNRYSDRPQQGWFKYISWVVSGVRLHEDLHQDIAKSLSSKAASNLRVIDLKRTDMGSQDDKSIETMTNSPHLNGLLRLNLMGNDLSEESVESLILSTGLRSIQRLDLRNNPTVDYFRQDLLDRFGDAVILD